MEYRNKLQNIYADAENISNLLRIRCPHITTAYICAAPDGSLQFGRKFLKSECQNLEKNMVILADVAFTNNETYIGTLAHELRHIWQSIYQPELYKTSAQGEAGLYSKGEIDADGFAFFYASKVLQKSIEEVAPIICPDEYENYKAAYKSRLNRAYEIEQEYTPKPAHKKPTLKDKINNLFNRKGETRHEQN